MKLNAISKKFFNPEQIESALAAATELPVEDAENPRTDPGDWENAIVSHSCEELRGKLAMAALYLALTTSLSLLVSWLERHLPVRGGERG